MQKEHHYQLDMQWTGNRGTGTSHYTHYDRSHVLKAAGKPDLLGSSDPAFRGDSSKWNPEELLLAAISACHMLWYLHFCADQGICVTAYEDHPTATMVLTAEGSGKFTQATLYPKITIADASQSDIAKELHHKAHQFCFIANSLNFPVEISPLVNGS